MSVIDEYLVSLEVGPRAQLERVRNIVRQTVPDAEETISYNMPAFRYKNKPLFYFAAFKHHLSVFPTATPTAALKDKLADYKVSKGTIQFTIDKPLPSEIIRELLRIRVAIIDGQP